MNDAANICRDKTYYTQGQRCIIGSMAKDENKIKLSDEFKRDLKKKITVNWPAIVSLVLLIIFIFTALGVGTYEIFFKPDKVETKVTSEEKIQSRPKTETTTPSTTQTQTKTPSTTQTQTPTPPAYDTYTVVEGDTLSGIASQYSTTSKAIADYNGWSDPETVLHIGQKIKIPK